MTRENDRRQKGRPDQSAPEKKASGKKAAPRKGPLTGEDQDLWQKLAQSVEPLRHMKPRVAKSERSGLDAASPRVETGTWTTGAARVRCLSELMPVVPHVATQKAPPPLAPFDRKRSRRIASGRIDIEARLDLHGARQVEAYGRFRTFLTDCASRGLSTVLIVTGKGGPRSDTRLDNSDRGEFTGYGMDAPERGILRRSVPMWLEEPELRLLVASYTTADVKHGGDGALYIHLRRRRA